MGVTIDDARAIAATLPRSYEALVRNDMRFRVGRLVYDAIDGDELRELLVDAWRMCVPKTVAAAYDG
jgi:hypothetical protein